MSTVLGIRESKWNKQDTGEEITTYYVSLRDDTGEREVPCYDAKAAELKDGQPLPEGWEVKTSKAGKPYLATPRAARGGGGGGMAAYRNTAEGQAYDQERMDRRTALMQAVDLTAHLPYEDRTRLQDRFADILRYCDQMYEWLRSPVSRAQAATGAPAASPPPGRGTSSARPRAEQGGMATSADNAPAGHAGAQQDVADASSADTGSAEKSGGAVYGEGTAPSGTTRVFPKKATDCPHRAKLVSYEGEQVCGGCGLPDALIGVKS